MIQDRNQQIGSSTIVKEKNTLSQPPKWSRSELVATSQSLRNMVGQTRAHVVRKITIRLYFNVTHAAKWRSARLEDWRMAQTATDLREKSSPIQLRCGVRSWRRRRGEPHKCYKVNHIRTGI